MNEQILTAFTPQDKIMSVGKRFGNVGLKSQQGTTRIIYDSLLLDGRDNYEFFKDVGSRAFPFKSLGLTNNKLEVGESLVIQRVYLSIVTIVGGVVTAIVPLDAATFPGIVGGEMNCVIANSQVLKPISVQSFTPQYNKNSTYDDYNNFEMDTLINIQPLLEFVFSLKATGGASIVDTYLRLTVEGVGAILAPKTTM